MTESGEIPSSPPLSRGTYNFNFDDFDEFSDPFKPKKVIPGGESVVGKSVDQNSNDSSKKVSNSILDGPSEVLNNVEEKESIEDDDTKKKKSVKKNNTKEKKSVKGDNAKEKESVEGDNAKEKESVKGDNAEEKESVEEDTVTEKESVKGDNSDEKESVKEDIAKREELDKGDNSEEKEPVKGGNSEEKESVNEDEFNEKESHASLDNEKDNSANALLQEEETSLISSEQLTNSSILVDMTDKPTSDSLPCLNDVDAEPLPNLIPTRETCSSSEVEKAAITSSPDLVTPVDESFDQTPEPSLPSTTNDEAPESNNNDIQPKTKPIKEDSSEEKKQPKKKKVLKKPKSKLKPPEHFNKQVIETDEIQIFAPPPRSTTNDSEIIGSEFPDQTSDNLPSLSDPAGISNSEDITIEPAYETSVKKMETSIEKAETLDIVTNGDKVIEPIKDHLASVISENNMTDSLEKAKEMAANLDIVHEFGVGEEAMLDLDNEGFVPASEVFNDSADWGILEKFGDNSKIEDGPRDSLYEKFDPLTPSRGATQSKVVKSEQNENTTQGQDDLMQMTTPPAKKSHTSQKHPAARALSQQVDASPVPAGVTKEVGQMYFGPGKDEKKKQEQDDVDDQPYFDAPDSPLPKEVKLGKVDKATGKMSGGSNTEVVQLVQDNHSSSDKVLKYSQTDWNKLKQELELEFQARLLNKEREWSKKLADRDKKIANLEEQSRTLKQSNDDMRAVVTEFEKIISELQADKEKSKSASQETVQDLKRERDQAIEDLEGVEASFSDLHRRYEKTKSVVEGFKKNEELLKRCVSDYQTKLKKTEDKAQSIKIQAEEKLNIANIEMEKLRKSTAGETARYEAALKKAELHVQSLERSLECKIKENEELTSICDELIAKVGT